MTTGVVAMVSLESVARVPLSSTVHQLALDNLREAGSERDGRDEGVSLCNGVNPRVEMEMCVLEPISDVHERDAGLYGAQFLF